MNYVVKVKQIQRSAAGVPIRHHAMCVWTTIRLEVIRVLVPTSTCRSNTAVLVCCLVLVVVVYTLAYGEGRRTKRSEARITEYIQLSRPNSARTVTTFLLTVGHRTNKRMHRIKCQ